MAKRLARADRRIAVASDCVVAPYDSRGLSPGDWADDSTLVGIAESRSQGHSTGHAFLASGRMSARVPLAMTAYAAFLLAFFADASGALPALIAAHRFLAASAIAFRPAAINLHSRRTGVWRGDRRGHLGRGLQSS